VILEAIAYMTDVYMTDVPEPHPLPTPLYRVTDELRRDDASRPILGRPIVD